MRTRIRIAGVEATIDVELRWRVIRVNDTSPRLVRGHERDSPIGVTFTEPLWADRQTGVHHA